MKKIILFILTFIISYFSYAEGGWFNDKVRAATNNSWVGSTSPPIVYAGDWFEGEIWLWYQDDPGLGAQFVFTTNDWGTTQYDPFSRGTVSGSDARYSNEGSAIGPWSVGTVVKYKIQCWHAWKDPDFYTTEASFTVNALNNPSSQNASQNGTNPASEVDLSWSKDAQNHNVMIVRKKSTESWTEPTQGTSYSVGNNIGSGVVVYNSSGTSYTNTGLTSSTTYDYKYYSENYSYYSAGVVANATTASAASDYYRSKATGNWSDNSTWESSNDNSFWIDATLVPTSSANTTTIDHAITITGNQTANALTINSSKTLTINPLKSLTVSGTFTNNAGNSGLVIESDATGTGSLIENNGVAATVERYLTDDRWHYVSYPVDDPYAGVFMGMWLKYWMEPTSVWKYITDPDTTLLPIMTGYALWTNNVGTATFTGSLNTGSKSLYVTNTDGGPSANDGFNFAGNPYPSAIDWEVDDGNGWTRTNIDPTIYIFNGNPGYGNYGSYNKVTNISQLGVDNIIPPHQGYFIHCDSAAGSATLSVNNGARVHNTKEILKSESINSLLLKLRVAGNNYSDEIILNIQPESSVNFDCQLDALKLKGYPEAPQFYSLGVDNRELSINSFPETEEYQEIPLCLEVGVNALYTISVKELSGFDPTDKLYLEDKVENTFTELTGELFTYSFSANPGDEPSRFVIHLNGEMAVPENNAALNNIRVYSFGDEVYITSAESLTGSVTIYDLIGQKIFGEQLNGETVKNISLQGQYGYLIVNVITEMGSLNKKVFIR
jgi:hypothetical protein